MDVIHVRGKKVVIVKEKIRPSRFYWIDSNGNESAGYFFSRASTEKDALKHANRPID